LLAENHLEGNFDVVVVVDVSSRVQAEPLARNRGMPRAQAGVRTQMLACREERPAVAPTVVAISVCLAALDRDVVDAWADVRPRAGDRPRANGEMARGIRAGTTDTVLLGATGTGKTATVAWLAERLQRPVLVMLPNKTLAAQFANELREMLPENAVEYFVSYYD